MKKEFIQTPAILVDLDALENNIAKYQEGCTFNKKELWPMIKTHKSTEIVKMQIEAGATGVLCGTLDEAEACCKAGVNKIMYAYPVASAENIERVIELTNKCDFIIRLDDVDGAKKLNDAAIDAGVIISYTIIIDAGLHRFGVKPDKAVHFANALKDMKGLKLRGISSHPGHVYAAGSKDDLSKYIDDEINNIKIAVDSLKNAGYKLEYITSGSTPTFFGAVEDKNINVYHPGNYVFHDAIQMSTETAKIEDCALTVLATVVSHPSEDLYICDAGAKCLGLDQGAHGNNSIVGFGKVKNHPEIVVYGLSEEVGKLHVESATTLKVGDKIEIIPNHSCSTANLTNHLIGIRKGEVEKVIDIDIRGNSTRKNV